jgi:hypothetical protein
MHYDPQMCQNKKDPELTLDWRSFFLYFEDRDTLNFQVPVAPKRSGRGSIVVMSR